jgi:Ca2+-binding RTX toxin-like protein
LRIHFVLLLKHKAKIYAKYKEIIYTQVGEIMSRNFIRKPLNLAGIAAIITAVASILAALNPQLLPNNIQSSTHPPEKAPIAQITGGTEANTGESVTLYGSSSTDLDGKIVAYEWYQIDGISVDLKGESTDTTTFTAPFSSDHLSFRLTVTDNDGLTGTDAAGVNIKNVSQSTKATQKNDDGDVIEGTDERDVINGNNTDDHIEGHGKDDTIYGHGGRDKLEGGKGDDILYGGDGDDLLQGESKGDKLFGESGNDELSGGDGDDQLSGGDGDDQLTGGLDSDTFACGEGRDIVLDFNLTQIDSKQADCEVVPE